MISAQPFGGMGAPQQPPMQLNPAYLQWLQQKQAWDAENQRRQQQFDAACQLIKSDAATSYKIDIEADSTVAADEQAEKQSRTEFLQALTPFLGAMIPQMEQNPALRPLISELIMFGVRAFPTSRQLEDAFESALQKMEQMPPNPQEGQQGHGNTKSPMEIQTEAQTEAGKQQVQQQANAVKMAQIQADTQIAAAKLMAEQQHNAADLALRGREIEGREALENARISHIAARDAAGLV